MKKTAVSANLQTLLANMVPDDKPKNIVEGDPETHYAALMSQDGLDVGVWRCTKGSWNIDSYSIDEVMLIHSGKMRLTDGDGNSQELSKGDLFYIPKGWNGRWEVLEEMEKVYVIMS